MTTDKMPNVLEPSQSARDAAEFEADAIYLANSDVLCQRDRDTIRANLVQAFAQAEQRGQAQGAAERAELVAEVGRLKAMMAAKPWPPTDAELRGMLADIVGAWWSKATGNYIRQAPSNAKLGVADIKGLYAVRDALAPYVARAALPPHRVREADEQQEDV